MAEKDRKRVGEKSMNPIEVAVVILVLIFVVVGFAMSQAPDDYED